MFEHPAEDPDAHPGVWPGPCQRRRCLDTAAARVLASLCFSAAASWAALAHADHPAGTYGAATAFPRPSVEVDVRAARYDLSAGRGAYQTATVGAEFAFLRRASLGVRLPFGHIVPDDGDPVTGPGDAQALAKALVWHNDATAALSGGLAVEAPTGDPDSGLGAAHWEIAPFFAGSWAGDLFMVQLTGSVHMSMVGRSHRDGRAILHPHGGRELSLRPAVALLLAHFYVATGGNTMTPLGSNRDGVATLYGETGTTVGEHWLVAVAYETPVIGTPRFEGQFRIGLAWRGHLPQTTAAGHEH